MPKKIFLIFLFLFSTGTFGITGPVNRSDYANNQSVKRFEQLSPEKLLSTANDYFNQSDIDTALTCYRLLINALSESTDAEQLKMLIDAYNRSAVIYQYMSDFQTAYNLLIKALQICEKHHVPYESKIYTNIGNIYYRFNRYDMARSYYHKALDLSRDSTVIVGILNNIALVEIKRERLDSAFHFLNKALKISKQNQNIHLHTVLNTVALAYREVNNYDSAYYYFQLAIDKAKKNNKTEEEADNLSHLGAMFFEMKKTDSTLFYLELSNAIAEENNFFRILAENYLILSKMEKLNGNETRALDYFEKYANLKDTVFNTDKFADINQIQRLYEVSKTNEQIEQFAIEQRINERTIHYQQIILFITLAVLILVCGLLFVIFLKNKHLNTAYEVLVEKNVEIADLQKNTSSDRKNLNKTTLSDDMQLALLTKIQTFMEDTSIICDTEFSIHKLANLVQSNQKYVSQVINDVLKKNFRSFLNGYRIQEAQRLFSESATAKYTIDFVALQVGFKSRNAFSDAFKEITGVSPTFYLKSIRKQQEVK